ncbi:hypothetical protein Bbelb_280950 [Branchiostoma belcheri]|nr:hypothetical protein Bbelb_280950 [Branchiostoma belcheri]
MDSQEDRNRSFDSQLRLKNAMIQHKKTSERSKPHVGATHLLEDWDAGRYHVAVFPGGVTGTAHTRVRRELQKSSLQLCSKISSQICDFLGKSGDWKPADSPDSSCCNRLPGDSPAPLGSRPYTWGIMVKSCVLSLGMSPSEFVKKGSLYQAQRIAENSLAGYHPWATSFTSPTEMTGIPHNMVKQSRPYDRTSTHRSVTRHKIGDKSSPLPKSLLQVNYNPRGRPRRKWYDNVREDFHHLNLDKIDPQDRGKWRAAIKPQMYCACKHV